MHIRWSGEYPPKMATGPLQPASSGRCICLSWPLNRLSLQPPPPAANFPSVPIYHGTCHELMITLLYRRQFCLPWLAENLNGKPRTAVWLHKSRLKPAPGLRQCGMSSSLDPSKVELLESSAWLGTDVKEMYLFFFPSFLLFLHMRCRSFLGFYSGTPRLGSPQPPLCGSFNCLELPPTPGALKLVVHRLVLPSPHLHLYPRPRPCVETTCSTTSPKFCFACII